MKFEDKVYLLKEASALLPAALGAGGVLAATTLVPWLYNKARRGARQWAGDPSVVYEDEAAQGANLVGNDILNSLNRKQKELEAFASGAAESYQQGARGNPGLQLGGIEDASNAMMSVGGSSASQPGFADGISNFAGRVGNDISTGYDNLTSNQKLMLGGGALLGTGALMMGRKSQAEKAIELMAKMKGLR